MKMEHVLLARTAASDLALPRLVPTWRRGHRLAARTRARCRAGSPPGRRRRRIRTISAPTCSASSTATPSRSTRTARPPCGYAHAGPAPARGNIVRPVRRGQLHRIRPARRGRAGAPPQHGGPDRQPSADGMVTGIGGVNGRIFGERRRTVVMGYGRHRAPAPGGAPTTPRPTACWHRARPTCPWYCLPRAAAEARRCRPTCRWSPAACAFAAYAALSGQVPWSASRQGASLPVNNTRLCWVATTPSSPARQWLSAWAAQPMIEGSGLECSSQADQSQPCGTPAA